MTTKVKPIPFGEDFVVCVRCRIPYPKKQVQRNTCPVCRQEKQRLMAQELAKSDNRAIAKASREILNQINKAGDESAIMPSVLEGFLSKLGGKEGYAEILAEDFQHARGVGLTEEEIEDFKRRDAIVVKYHNLITHLMSKMDADRHVDASGLTDEDLQATLRSLCVQMVQCSPDFRRAIIREALTADPDLRKEIMEMEGKVVVPADPPLIAEDEPDLDEAKD